MDDRKRFEEVGQESEADLQVNLSTFSQAVVWGTDWTTETILTQLRRNNIELNPAFQRRDAWGRAGKSRFIESLILGLPIPQLILAESKDRRGTFIVIDGKQRLLSIRQFFANDSDSEFEPLKLNELEILHQLRGKTYQEMQDDFSFEPFVTALENQTIRTTIIRNWPDEAFLFTVFLRLNNGSVKLSPQELRQALHPGPFITFADNFSIESASIKNMLKIENPDPRMRDVELVVRFYAFKKFILNYRGNLKLFFDDTVNQLNQNWRTQRQSIISLGGELEAAIDTTITIFGRDAAFSKWTGSKYQNTFNRAIFDIMVYYFSDQMIRTAALDHQVKIEDSFKFLSVSDNIFLRSFETSTKNMEPTFKRFSAWGMALFEIIQIPMHIPQLINGQIQLTEYR